MTSRRSFMGSLLSAAFVPSISPESTMPNPSSREAKPTSNKRALVLSGGGIKGAFQAGAIAEVLSRGFQPDILVGTSIGALNAAFLADRAGRNQLANQAVDWGKVGESLEAFWRTRITGPDCIIDKKGIGRIGRDVLLKQFSGFVGIEPAKRIVREEIKLDNVRAARLTLRVTTVNVVSGALALADLSSAAFVDYILASSAEPMVMPLIKIGDALYADGGIREVAPVQAAIDLGADEITCIVCQAKQLGAKNFNPRNFFQLARRFMDIITNEIVTNDIDRLKKESALREEVLSAKNQPAQRTVRLQTVIRPSTEIDVDMESFTSEDIKQMISTGHDAARAVDVRAVVTLTVG